MDKGNIRIILADDHQLVRDGFCALLEQQPDMEVVGAANNGREALELTRKLLPDMVVMDMAMPDLNGVDATWEITRDFSDVKVLALSMYNSQRLITQMLQAGASGYLVKSCALEELVLAVRAVAAGKTYLSPDIAGSVVEDYRVLASGNDSPDPTNLSHRQREVLQLVAEGKSTKEIASALHMGIKTAEGHRHDIMQKLGLHSIAELTKYAIREGLTSVE